MYSPLLWSLWLKHSALELGIASSIFRLEHGSWCKIYESYNNDHVLKLPSSNLYTILWWTCKIADWLLTIYSKKEVNYKVWIHWKITRLEDWISGNQLNRDINYRIIMTFRLQTEEMTSRKTKKLPHPNFNSWMKKLLNSLQMY